MKLEINYKTKTGKLTNMWRLHASSWTTKGSQNKTKGKYKNILRQMETWQTKLMRCSKRSSERSHTNKCLHQETRKILNKQSNFTWCELKKKCFPQSSLTSSLHTWPHKNAKVIETISISNKYNILAIVVIFLHQKRWGRYLRGEFASFVIYIIDYYILACSTDDVGMIGADEF